MSLFQLIFLMGVVVALFLMTLGSFVLTATFLIYGFYNLSFFNIFMGFIGIPVTFALYQVTKSIVFGEQRK